jgi:hypothetical protein
MGRHNKQLENLKLSLEKKYSKIIYQVSRKIPMVEDSYVYSLVLFKKALLKIDSVRNCKNRNSLSYEDKFMLRRFDDNRELFGKLDMIFKCCMFQAYKMIEDEYSLFIKDYAGVTKDDWEDMQELEIFLVCDVMHFNLWNLDTIVDEIKQEKKVLTMLATEC